jgi:O-phosphoseryl-tRNA synthetase
METRFNPSEILAWVNSEGFEHAWLRSGELIAEKGGELRLDGVGTPHPVSVNIQQLREGFLRLGFDEVLTPIIVEDEEVYRQYGPEAPIILDRCYYLATLPRPDIGLSDQKLRKITSLGIAVDEEKRVRLQELLRNYKRGSIDADDLVEHLVVALDTRDSLALRVVREVFPEFTALRPVPTNLTLRAHLTSAWFNTLKVLQHRRSHPIKLFSIGIRFRREQSEDATHLRAHYGASCVVLDEAVSIDDGKRLTERLLRGFDFTKVTFVQKAATSKYYAPGTEFEGFVRVSSGSKAIEVVDFGMYSPVALARYGIEYPALNVGLGVERLAMLVQREDDIRRIAYPQVYGQWTLTDAELAGMIRVASEPRSEVGRAIVESIVRTALRHADAPSPCAFVAFEGNVLGMKTRVTVYEKDAGAKLLGPAALNSIYVHQANVLGIPEVGLERARHVVEARDAGVPTGIRYLDALAALAATRIERMVMSRAPLPIDLRVRVAKQPSDVNVRVEAAASYYITGRQKRIAVKGPVFVGIKAEFLR